jgi:hypothetical protein
MVETLADKVNIKLDDGTIVPVNKDVAQMSKLISDAIEEDPEAEDMEVPVKEVSKETLDSVIVYMTHIVGIEPLKIESPLTKPLDEILANTWYLEFIQKLNDD